MSFRLVMQKISLSLLLVGLLLFCFSQDPVNKNNISIQAAYKQAESIYQQAETLAVLSDKNDELTPKADEQYKKALAAYTQLLPSVINAGMDSLSFWINLRRGTIFHYFDSLDLAKQSYLAALSFRQKTHLNDSFFFKPNIYTGSIYYSGSQLDSAQYYLRKAEEIDDQYHNTLSETQRLYNLSGVINFQLGNYRQAENYFEKAVAILEDQHSPEKSLLTNYKINIGLTLVKLKEFDKAKVIYEMLLKQNISTNEIYHNLGYIYLKEKDYSGAIANFRKVNYESDKKSIELYVNMAMAFSAMDQADSADLYLLKAKTENLKWNGKQKNISNGLILKFEGDELARQGLYEKSVASYQQAIHQLDTDFTEDSISSNPSSFTGAFSYINLFNTLSGKAEALEKLYSETKEIKTLQSALGAYHSAFSLADYVEKTYNSDEARLFLGEIKYTVHSKPIHIGLQLYTITHDKKYLEEAYLFDQQNKASILSINILENELKNNAAANNPLIQKEATLRSAITRLSLKATGVTDSNELQRIRASIRDNEIELDKVQENIYADPSWQQKRAAEKIPTIAELQKKLDNSTALLSYHMGEKEMLVFLISANQFDYFISPINPIFLSDLDSFKLSLHNISSDEKYNGSLQAHNLYKKLVDPIRSSLAQKKRLIIIPDDELNYLPFEALQDDNNKYLIESFSVQYQYSTALLGKKSTTINESDALAFAPFSAAGYSDPNGGTFSPLPASREETKDLKGKTFSDSAATKKNFLNNLNRYNIIHLATHASVNNESPDRSFIAFYPNNPDYKLYAQEIYNLRLDSTQLIILSACETGTGKLVRGEGLMSLSRAFAYAGCPNIVTSLWKAEDKTTAFLTSKFHFYLKKGYTKDKALQQAKLDLLKDPTISPRFKTPNYWANFIFIGNYQPGTIPSHWWWIAGSILLAAILYIILRKKA